MKCIHKVVLILDDETEYEVSNIQFDNFSILVQSQADAEEYSTGVLSSSGSIGIIDYGKKILGMIDDEQITSDGLHVKSSLNGVVYSTTVTATMTYTTTNWAFNLSIQDSLANMENVTYEGVSAANIFSTDEEDATNIPFSSLLEAGADDYVTEDSAFASDFIVVGNSRYGYTTITVPAYVRSIYSFNPNISEMDLKTAWEQLCAATQLQTYFDNGLQIKSARPRMYSLENVIYIPLKSQYSDFDMNPLPDNKYTQVNVTYTDRFNYERLPFYGISGDIDNGGAGKTIYPIGANKSVSGMSGSMRSWDSDGKDYTANCWAWSDNDDGGVDRGLLSSLAADGYATFCLAFPCGVLTPSSSHISLTDTTKIEKVYISGNIFTRTYDTSGNVTDETTIALADKDSPLELDAETNTYFPVKQIAFSSLSSYFSFVQDSNGEDSDIVDFTATLDNLDLTNKGSDPADKGISLLGVIPSGTCGGMVYSVYNGKLIFFMAIPYACTDFSYAYAFNFSSGSITLYENPSTEKATTFRYLDNFAISIKFSEETENITKTYGSDTTGNHTLEVDLTDNDFIDGYSYTTALYDTLGENVNMIDMIGYNLLEDYASGARTASVSVCAMDYNLYVDGAATSNTAKSLENGEFIRVGDLVKVEQDSRIWRVTSTNISYNGQFLVDLQMREMTGDVIEIDPIEGTGGESGGGGTFDFGSGDSDEGGSGDGDGTPSTPGKGEKGDKGDKGDTGDTGADGVGITSAKVVNGYLIITYTDGTTQNAGYVIGSDGADGQDGADGADGKDGTDGVGIKSITYANNTLTITLTDGTVYSFDLSGGSTTTTYTVTLDDTDGTGTVLTYSSDDYDWDGVIEAAPTLTRTGYTFNGWFTSSNVQLSSDNFSGDIEASTYFYGSWKQNLTVSPTYIYYNTTLDGDSKTVTVAVSGVVSGSTVSMASGGTNFTASYSSGVITFKFSANENESSDTMFEVTNTWSGGSATAYIEIAIYVSIASQYQVVVNDNRNSLTGGSGQSTAAVDGSSTKLSYGSSVTFPVSGSEVLDGSVTSPIYGNYGYIFSYTDDEGYIVVSQTGSETDYSGTPQYVVSFQTPQKLNLNVDFANETWQGLDGYTTFASGDCEAFDDEGSLLPELADEDIDAAVAKYTGYYWILAQVDLPTYNWDENEHSPFVMGTTDDILTEGDIIYGDSLPFGGNGGVLGDMNEYYWSYLPRRIFYICIDMTEGGEREDGETVINFTVDGNTMYYFEGHTFEEFHTAIRGNLADIYTPFAVDYIMIKDEFVCVYYDGFYYPLKAEDGSYIDYNTAIESGAEYTRDEETPYIAIGSTLYNIFKDNGENMTWNELIAEHSDELEFDSNGYLTWTDGSTTYKVMHYVTYNSYRAGTPIKEEDADEEITEGIFYLN